MPFSSEFERILATAAGALPDDCPVPEDVVLAARYAARTGWQDSLHGVTTNRARDLALSGTDGTLEFAATERYRYPGAVRITRWEQAVDILVVYGVLPDLFSPNAGRTLQNLALAHERVADHVLSQHATGTGPDAQAALARTWMAAADSARDFRIARLRELADGFVNA